MWALPFGRKSLLLDPQCNSHAASAHWLAERLLMLQVLECYALNEPPPEEVNDGTKPDDEGMQKNMEAIIGFRVSFSPFMFCAMVIVVLCTNSYL